MTKISFQYSHCLATALSIWVTCLLRVANGFGGVSKNYSIKRYQNHHCKNGLLLPPALLQSKTNNDLFKRRHMSMTSSSSSSSETTRNNDNSNNNNDEESFGKKQVSNLKRILEREYTTFFDPMYTEYYASDVTFEDPMTSLDGVEAYRSNVDMLASRTLMGKFLFDDAGIVLHNVEGGEVEMNENTGAVDVKDIITRWTLRLTAKALPWKPTARFSGISVYKLQLGKNSGEKIQIVGQTDYWDSINIDSQKNSNYGYTKVEKSIAIQDFLNQLKPGGFQAQAAAPELPYQLLRRGNGYEVRKYPPYSAVRLPYNRRDEGFGSLGAFSRGMDPLSPALMDVQKDDISDKYMTWPLRYALPTAATNNDGMEKIAAPIPSEASEKAGQGQWRTVKVIQVPESIVAVLEFSDASMEPVVRKADRELRDALARDGLEPDPSSNDLVRFAQYDAIFSMGKRRGEVWIDLMNGGHPW